MLRELALPQDVEGRLFLQSMPGRYVAFDQDCREFLLNEIDRVISLAPLEEIKIKSPAYAKAITLNCLQWKHEMFPIQDFGVPEDREEFVHLVRSLAHRLQKGERILIHCGAGIGRTGTVAICVLLELGQSLENARASVRLAGSSPETSDQQELISWAATFY